MTDARDGQSRTIRQFHFTDWPEQGVPKSGEGFIDFIGQVHKTKEQFGQEGPISVHCRLVFLYITCVYESHVLMKPFGQQCYCPFSIFLSERKRKDTNIIVPCRVVNILGLIKNSLYFCYWFIVV